MLEYRSILVEEFYGGKIKNFDREGVEESG